MPQVSLLRPGRCLRLVIATLTTENPMAQPVAFTPKKVDPRLELQSRLAAAPNEHAEALLAAYDLLEEAHRQGILDALHGAIKAKDTIATLLAEFAAQPANINAVRHIIAVGQMVGSFDPEPISNLAKEAYNAMETQGRESRPPSLWQLYKRMNQPDTRRGLSFVTSMLGALGRAWR
jgi:uncharacterized protein YjgD (DUF1641 family)